MKFYIFADDSDVINATVKNARFMSDDYNKVLEVFDQMNKEYKYANSYLIADFEVKHSSMFGYDSLENIKEYVVIPFLIIREFHYSENPIKCNAIGDDGKIDSRLTIRHDSITVETSGFVQEFNDNQAALYKFLYCLDNSIPASMNFLFVEPKAKDSNGKQLYAEYKRKIASSIEVLRGRIIPLKKIKLDKNLNIQKYEFPKRKFYNFTFEKSTTEMVTGMVAN